MSKGTKSIAFYFIMILVFGSLMYLIAKEGERQQIESAITAAYDTPKDLGEGFSLFWELMTHHIQSPIGILLLQIITILLTCRLFGWLFQKIGQPTVIGEIVAVSCWDRRCWDICRPKSRDSSSRSSRSPISRS